MFQALCFLIILLQFFFCQCSCDYFCLLHLNGGNAMCFLTTPHLVMSCWSLEIRHRGSIYSMESGKHVKQGSPSPTTRKSAVKYLPSQHWMYSAG